MCQSDFHSLATVHTKLFKISHISFKISRISNAQKYVFSQESLGTVYICTICLEFFDYKKVLVITPPRYLFVIFTCSSILLVHGWCACHLRTRPERLQLETSPLRAPAQTSRYTISMYHNAQTIRDMIGKMFSHFMKFPKTKNY